MALTPAQADSVRAIVESVIPGAEVRVFGSRATGRARPFSDLDLLFVQPARLTWLQRADLRDLFEASDLPFRVDVVEADGLAGGMAPEEKIWPHRRAPLTSWDGTGRRWHSSRSRSRHAPHVLPAG